uniref:Uncharacterized protein n=1 Tax=Caloglossa monosticha TaxID=76906 RepID=A0A1Z1M5H5_9FLOR|nr:hypothetical protein [Caloglossa monosticha]ARW61024.1 hypothetical protein [Caloglossa monosticha]
MMKIFYSNIKTITLLKKAYRLNIFMILGKITRYIQ